jgi:hypothetical protein
MEMKKGVLTLAIGGILALSMVLTASSALALGGPIEGTRFAGPAIRVTLTLVAGEACVPECPDDESVVVDGGSGRCHGIDFSIGSNYEGLCDQCFSELNEDNIENGYIADSGAAILEIPDACLPFGDSIIEGWYIQHVFSYTSYSEGGIEYKIVDALIILVVGK